LPVYRREPQPAQDVDEQEVQEEPPPAMTPSLPMAANREMARRVSWLPQCGQAMGASALAIGRSASKRRWHCWQIYSYRGIFHLAYHFTVSSPKSQPLE
jgi:hypothetical protein